MIIKHGNMGGICDCPYCGCEFIYNFKSGICKIDNQKGSINICPECGKPVFVRLKEE